jgi:hypothetical protein
LEQLEMISDVQGISAAKAKKRFGGSGAGRVKRLMVSELEPTREIRILPKDYGRLALDPRYQRQDIAAWHNDLRDALKRGTKTPAIAVAVREWHEEGMPTGMLWVVDGQQRMWAHVDLDLPIVAKEYHTSSLEEEKRLFVVLNHKVPIGPNHTVKAHPGISAKFLAEINENPSHPLCNRIQFQDGGTKARYGAASLVGLVCVTLVGKGAGVIANLISMDRLLERPTTSRMVSDLLASMALSFSSKASHEMLRAWGLVARQLGGRPMTKMECSKIRRLKLESVVAASSTERVVLIQRRMLKTLKVEQA